MADKLYGMNFVFTLEGNICFLQIWRIPNTALYTNTHFLLLPQHTTSEAFGVRANALCLYSYAYNLWFDGSSKHFHDRMEASIFSNQPAMLFCTFLFLRSTATVTISFYHLYGHLLHNSLGYIE